MKKSVIVFLLIMGTTFAQVWGPDMRLTVNDSNSVTTAENARSITVSGDNVHVVWIDSRSGNNEVYYKNSQNKGATWNGNIKITNTPEDEYSPNIASNGSNIYIVWEKEYGVDSVDIFFTRSTNNGTTWSPPEQLTTSGEAMRPAICAAGNHVYIVWADERDGNFEIYFKHSSDNGDNWDADYRITSDDSASFLPAVSASGNNVYVSWIDNRNGLPKVYYNFSINNGSVWQSSDIAVSDDGYEAFSSSIVGNNSDVYVAWQGDTVIDSVNVSRVLFNSSNTLGLSWGPKVVLSDTAGDAKIPSIANYDSNVYVVWTDYRDMGDGEIYYRHSDNKGSSWQNAMRLTDDDSVSDFVSITNVNDELHIVWSDTRDGNFEVYYKNTHVELQPDNLIKAPSDDSYIGEDIYNTTGENQIKEQILAGGDTAVYQIKIENDGNVKDTFVVKGDAAPDGWEIKYYDAFDGGTDITSRIVNDGWVVSDLEPGDSVHLRMEVIPSDGVPGDSTIDTKVTTNSSFDDSKEDVVIARSTTASSIQVDNLIKNIGEVDYIGNNIYNNDATNQTKIQSIESDSIAIFHIRVENDGNSEDSIRITGTGGSSKWDVKYYDALTGGSEITSDVVGAGYSVVLASGAYTEIRAEVSPQVTDDTISYSIDVTSTSLTESTQLDVVRGSVSIGSGGVAEGSIDKNLSVKFRNNNLLISYSLEKDQDVSISIFDITGKKVIDIVKGSLDRGVYAERINVDKLGTGIFFIRMKTNEKELIKKIYIVE